MCLRVFYQGPWLEGKEKGVLFLPSRPVIMFTANLALSFRQLGPVPIWRDLQSYERCFGGQTLSRSCLVWNSIPHRPLKKKQKHTVPLSSQAFIFGVCMTEGFIVRGKWEWFYFPPSPKKTGFLGASLKDLDPVGCPTEKPPVTAPVREGEAELGSQDWDSKPESSTY